MVISYYIFNFTSFKRSKSMAFTIQRYNDDIPRMAFQLALLGATDKQMAAVFGVDVQTIDYWKRTKRRFRLALEKGKTEADSEVAAALYKRAKGFSVIEDHVTMYKGQIIVTPVRKHYPPDTMAAKIWLNARQKEHWSETQKVEVTNTNINITKIDFSGLTNEELALAKKLGMKQLMEHAGSDN